MNSVKEIALSFCASAVFCAGIGIVGGSSLQKSGRYIIALIMLCSIIGAVASSGLDLSSFTEIFVSEEASAETENMSGFAAEQLVGEFLRGKGIGFEKITAEVTKTEESDIVINELIFSGVRDPAAVEKALADIGIDCRVVFD